MKEWMDVYDCQGRLKTQVQTTSQSPQDGNYYLTTRIWVRDMTGNLLAVQCAGNADWTLGCWKAPGDFAAAGESAEQAAVRALREQTGLNVSQQQWRQLGSQRYRDTHNGMGYHIIAHLFLVQLTGKAPPLHPGSEEIQSCLWVPGDSFASFLQEEKTDPITALCFQQYRNRILDSI